MRTSSSLSGWNLPRTSRLLTLGLLTILLSSVAPFGVTAQQDPNGPRITSLTLANPAGACSLSDGETISGTVQSENLADTTAVYITALFGYSSRGFYVEWGQGTSIAGLPPDDQGQYTSSQIIPENGAWAFGRNATDDRTRAGSFYREGADQFIVQANLYDSQSGYIFREDPSTGTLYPWQVVVVDLTQCTDAPPPPPPPPPTGGDGGGGGGPGPAPGLQVPAEEQQGQSLPGGSTPPEQVPTPPEQAPVAGLEVPAEEQQGQSVPVQPVDDPVAPPSNGTTPTSGEQLPAEEQQGQPSS